MTSVLLLRVATRPFDSLETFHGSASPGALRALAASENRIREDTGRLSASLFEAAGPPGHAPSAPRLAVLAIRRAIHNRKAWSVSDESDAAPLLGDELRGALDRHASSRRDLLEIEDRARAAIEADLARGREALAAACADPFVREGIFFASRDLAHKLEAVMRRNPSGWGHGDRHVAAKALAYVARFATKTSPNSVFCATALAAAGGDDCRVEGAPEIERIDVLLSVAEARKVACTLAFDAGASAAVVPRPNPTLREDGDRLTFWRFSSARHPDDTETFSRVKDHPVLRIALDEAAAGRWTLPDLGHRVANRAGIDEEALAPFLRGMIDLGVLVAEIEIPYNERRPLRHVARAAAAAGSRAAWIAPALAVESEVDALATLAPEARLRAVGGIADRLEALLRAREIRRDELFRLDAATSLSVRLPGWVLETLAAGLRPYARLFAAMYPAEGYREGWVRRFLARHPADTEIALLDVYRALTEEGESYRPAAFPEPTAEDESDPARAAAAAARTWMKQRALAAKPGEEIPFDDAVVDRFAPGSVEPRWACGVLFQIAAASPEAIARGDARIVLNGLFQGAGLSLSRFAHLHGGPAEDDGNPVVRELRRAWSAVARPGAVVAELTYNHLGRTANAGLRPAIFEHEIELPGDRTSPDATAIPLRELAVRFDGALRRLVLRWTPRDVEVIPVINSGVNPVGFVSFLVAIGEQGLQPLGYLPGFDDPEVTRWPRVVCERLVVFRERWVFRRDTIPQPSAKGDDLVPFVMRVADWRRAHALPRHVYVHTSKEPKPRYVDLESPVFLDLLRRDLAALSGDAVTLHVTEMLPGPEDLWIRGGGSGHAAELLAQMGNG